MTFLSIIVPTLNEEQQITATLAVLQQQRRGAAEVLVVDAGSSDRTVSLAEPLADRCLAAPRGRARQMNAAAASARGQWLLFLHADTRLPPDFLQQIRLAEQAGRHWGFFPLRLSGSARLLRVVERGINLRSRLSRVATGDQAIFVSSQLWQQLQGFADIPLMEDVDFSKRARRMGLPFVARSHLQTSSRRWQERGIVKTVVTMWWLRLLYWLGVNPARLARQYR
ncbi:MAG: glycosyltransferase family 2 protein [Gammaproteobacteria bacterium]|nr:glycosyltransferase family 2 protein [Gammaproteobacteria bacterium]